MCGHTLKIFYHVVPCCAVGGGGAGCFTECALHCGWLLLFLGACWSVAVKSFWAPLSEGEGGVSPRSCGSGTSHSNNHLGRGDAGDEGRIGNACKTLKMCYAIVPLREAPNQSVNRQEGKLLFAWGMAYLPTTFWALHAAAR